MQGVGGWMLEKIWNESEVTFEPNGETTSAGLQIGTITSIARKKVRATRNTIGPTADSTGYTIAAITGTPQTGGGLTIGIAGGGTLEIAPLLQTKPNSQTPDPYPDWTNTIAAWVPDQTMEGIYNQILGCYAHTIEFSSVTEYWVIGAWSGGGA